MERFIVAEITKNWSIGTPVTDLIGQRFEAVINTNLRRGYKLIDWKIQMIASEVVMTETIIAIFEKIE